MWLDVTPTISEYGDHKLYRPNKVLLWHDRVCSLVQRAFVFLSIIITKPSFSLLLAAFTITFTDFIFLGCLTDESVSSW